MVQATPTQDKRSQKDDEQSKRIASIWRGRSDDLAIWTQSRLVNRTDVWGGYNIYGQLTHPRILDRPKRTLGLDQLKMHFKATTLNTIIGLHTTSPQNLSRWGLIDIDCHEEGKDNPEANERAAMAWYDKARRQGFRPLLTDSNGKGGYHLRLIFAEPVPTPRVFHFMKAIVSDHKAHGLDAPPETFPKQEKLDESTPCGNWVRLPGKHHKRDHWTRVWDGQSWLEGSEAIDYIVSLEGDDPALVPEHVKPEVRAKASRENTARNKHSSNKSKRVAKYLDRCDPAVSGNRGHDTTFRVVCAIVNGFDLGDEEALSLLSSWNARCDPPWSEAELRHKITDAQKASHDKERGHLLNAEGEPIRSKTTTASKSQREEGQSGVEVEQKAAATVKDIIRDYFREIYEPTFKRETSIYSHSKERDIPAREACFGADSELIDRIAKASDAPRDENGNVKRGALPGVFANWCKTSWKDLLRTLDTEEEAAEITASAEDSFRARVSHLLLSHVTINGSEKTGDMARVERLPLIALAQRFGFGPDKVGPWKDVRGYQLWCRTIEGEKGIRLDVAFNHSLTSQVSGFYDLLAIPEKRFTRLCGIYGIGKSGDENRVKGRRAIRLNADYVSGLLSAPMADEDRGDAYEGEPVADSVADSLADSPENVADSNESAKKHPQENCRFDKSATHRQKNRQRQDEVEQ